MESQGGAGGGEGGHARLFPLHPAHVAELWPCSCWLRTAPPGYRDTPSGGMNRLVAFTAEFMPCFETGGQFIEVLEAAQVRLFELP